MRLEQRKKSGRYYVGNSEEILSYRPLRKLRGKIQLILTSPPFPLNKKKSYGNMTGDGLIAYSLKASDAERVVMEIGVESIKQVKRLPRGIKTCGKLKVDVLC